MFNDLIFRTLRGEETKSRPIWFMRQAGRYLPEYRELRAKAGNFLTMCQNPEFASEATIQPIKRFNLDAAIVFSDILTVPNAMGLELEFNPAPKFRKTIRSFNEAKNLQLPPPNSLDYVFNAVSASREKLEKLAITPPLIGFCGSPWTIATYMIEGEGSKDHSLAKAFLYQEEKAGKLLLEKLTIALSDYLRNQVLAGAQILMIFDSWGGALPYWAYEEFSLFYMQEIIKNLKAEFPQIPLILFSKGAANSLELMKNSGADCLGLDWTISLKKAREVIGDKIAIQGNLDPAILKTSPKIVKKEVKRVLADYGKGGKHIFNLGHGISPDIKIENVEAMVEAVREAV